MKTLKLSQGFNHNVAQWVDAIHADGPNNFTAGPTLKKAQTVRHFVSRNLTIGQVGHNRAFGVQCAANSLKGIRSAFASARDAFRCEYAIQRSLFSC